MVNLPGVEFGSRPGVTNLQFRGTSLMPEAAGTGRVDKQRDNIRVAANFTGLLNPTSFGHEYLTYVMWAITPDGRAINFGEVPLPTNRDAWVSRPPGSRASLTVLTPVRTFGLMVTAEPYFSVRSPSRIVVLETAFEAGTEPLQMIDITYDLTTGGGYVPTGFTFDAVLLRSNLPLEFFQARNAVRIAQGAGAEQHASAVYANAANQLKRVEELAGQRRINRRALVTAAREAVLTAEDAREAGARGTAARRLEEERLAAAAREAEARAQAQAELERRLREEAERTAAAEREREAAEAERISAEAQRLAAERDRAEADRASREAMARAEEALRAQQQAEARRIAALQQQQAAEAEAARNRAAAAELDQRLQQAIQDREGLRAQILNQLNLILETRDTARGLVVNLSDVTFSTGQATLQPGAREKLARVSGILAAHPTLRLAIEGHTDSVGSDELNQALSERRAEAVRMYLVQQGVPAGATSASGFGEARPVATNDTAEGRQMNRRVELVVSGEAIGTGAP
jgi:outer membrane protein OmpA-like peptidoglycan-associated protein